MLRLALGVAVLSLACGGDSSRPTSPVSPSPTPVVSTPPPAPTSPPQQSVPHIAGTWNGTAEQQYRGTRYFTTIQLTLTQDERVIRGSWRYTSPGWQDWRGDIVSGTLNGSGDNMTFVGNVGIVSDTATGTGACFGTMAMDGTVAATSMRWRGDSIVEQNCRSSVQDWGGFVWIFNR